jgi:hypothetical protein
LFELVGKVSRETVNVGEVLGHSRVIATEESSPRENEGINVLVGSAEFSESLRDQGAECSCWERGT